MGDGGEGPETSAALKGRVVGGGVAGGIPPQKGGPKARPPKSEERVKRSKE